MALTLEEYASWLDGRGLPWPQPPAIEPAKARPHVQRLPGIRAVLWNTYGTLIAIPPAGELLFEHPIAFVQSAALEKTIAEFKMWGSMSRKPGQPSEYMQKIYNDLLAEQRLGPGGGEKFPEVQADKIWEGVIKRLLQKDYKFDAGLYGSLNEYSKKVAYFFHASLQATQCPPTADRALAHVTAAGMIQGLLGDGQCFTAVQLQRGLMALGSNVRLTDLIPADWQFLSFEARARVPSERLLRPAIAKLAARGIEPGETLYVGSRIDRDIAPIKKLGFRTALFAGDKSSLAATADQLRDPTARPDLLLTELGQIADVVG
jgi:hypothetical protein